MPRANNFNDLTGKQFGKLKVVGLKGRNHYGKLVWLCSCECGATKEVVGLNLTQGVSTSCGCFQKKAARERFTKHGQRGSSTYTIWLNMKERCRNPKCPGWKYYGARGIKVCRRWQQSFAAFLSDMGARPAQMTLDRFPNNNGNYEPANCRWATYSEQRRNQDRYKAKHPVS